MDTTDEPVNDQNIKLKEKTTNIKLKDVNDDCLSEIFKLLSLADLVNIAESDSHYETAAVRVFKSKFAKGWIDVSNIFDPKTEIVSSSERLLNRFGGAIENLAVTYHEKYRRFDKNIDAAIIAKCTKTVLRLKIERAVFYTLTEIAEPFEKVLEVKFCNGELCNIISEFNRWFPKAMSLELIQIRRNNEDRSAFVHHFPLVEHFAVSNFYEGRGMIDAMNVLKFVELNPQLRSFWIEHDSTDGLNGGDVLHEGIFMYRTYIAEVVEMLPKLEKLYVRWTRDAEDCDVGRCENLEELTVVMKKSPPNFSGTFSDKLKVLNVTGTFNGCRNVIRCVTSARIVNILHVGYKVNYYNMESLFQDIYGLKNLEELRLPYKAERLNGELITELLKTCKKLTKLTLLRFIRTADIAEVVRSINNAMVQFTNNWTVSMKVERHLKVDYTEYIVVFEKKVE